MRGWGDVFHAFIAARLWSSMKIDNLIQRQMSFIVVINLFRDTAERDLFAPNEFRNECTLLKLFIAVAEFCIRKHIKLMHPKLF